MRLRRTTGNLYIRGRPDRGRPGSESKNSGPPYGFRRRTACHEAGSETRGSDADQSAPKGRHHRVEPAARQ